MICPECQKENKKSTVLVGVTTRTAMYCPSFYDEEGNYHCHDTNTSTTQYHCSNGHFFTTTSQNTCITCGTSENWK